MVSGDIQKKLTLDCQDGRCTTLFRMKSAPGENEFGWTLPPTNQNSDRRCYHIENKSWSMHQRTRTELSTHTHVAINICSWMQNQNSTSEHRSYKTHGHESITKTSQMSTHAIILILILFFLCFYVRCFLWRIGTRGDSRVEDRDPWRIRKIRNHLKCTMHCKYKLYLMKECRF